jgi:hypothetical protein
MEWNDREFELLDIETKLWHLEVKQEGEVQALTEALANVIAFTRYLAEQLAELQERTSEA